ncbi:hypothetical protein AchV4_0018 [Achromobacter phage vB_AchrS_AchV4]|uniref:Uncharacterized protein n=1 Tax=Achromobacter phage vB_AchrS_AchV4 TaxID=2796514 RepID=A0A7T3U752_9CAUD|nr:hypothetical protein JT316_gp18 [Achromobacter phage vB_AchrS_AchV4]QPZ53308.1 hypothetical protein AchV4_0018 [Achromobacter phage vB_AchrS_AchV4]
MRVQTRASDALRLFLHRLRGAVNTAVTQANWVDKPVKLLGYRVNSCPARGKTGRDCPVERGHALAGSHAQSSR